MHRTQSSISFDDLPAPALESIFNALEQQARASLRAVNVACNYVGASMVITSRKSLDVMWPSISPSCTVQMELERSALSQAQGSPIRGDTMIKIAVEVYEEKQVGVYKGHQVLAVNVPHVKLEAQEAFLFSDWQVNKYIRYGFGLTNAQHAVRNSTFWLCTNSCEFDHQAVCATVAT